MEVYGRGLAAAAGRPVPDPEPPYDLHLHYDDGTSTPVPLRDWCGPLHAGDRELLSPVDGPTIDLGCGPGRLVAELTARGVPALGVDLAPEAVRMARRLGAHALQRDLFGRLPGEGRWAYVLLADGNVGIGGDPRLLLRRLRRLLAADGTALVELDRPGRPTGPVRARLAGPDGVSGWFSWARLCVDDVAAVAAAAGLRPAATWTGGGRWFAALSPC